MNREDERLLWVSLVSALVIVIIVMSANMGG